MRVRLQIIEAGVVVKDTEMPAIGAYPLLKETLRANDVGFNPTMFYEQKGWVCFRAKETIYRTMNSRYFGA